MFAKTLLMALATVLVVLPHVQVLAQGETADDPFVVTTCEDLDGMRNNLDAFYVLGNNIDCSGTTAWNDGQGWEPIGTVAAPFTGSLDGAGHEISGLFIKRIYPFEWQDYIGLFGVTGPGSAIRNIGVVAVSIAGDDIVGAIAGDNHGTISDSYSSGTFTYTYSEVGGLVGHNNGIIHN